MKKFFKLADKLSQQSRIVCLLLGILVLPSIVRTILFEDFIRQTFELWLVMDVVVSIVVFYPLSWLICRLVLLGHVQEMNNFCEQIQAGGKQGILNLPPEEPDEDELIRLKRKLNQVARIADRREESLQYRLKQIDEQCSQFRKLTDTDPLTGLFNRRYIQNLMQDDTAHQYLNIRSCVLMLMDCDKFKEVNDSFGHAEGDQVLVCLGQTIQDSVREGVDHPFRFGGDEFDVLLSGLETDAAVMVAERIRSMFRNQNHRDCTLSIGLTPNCMLAETTWESLYFQADQALYRAKESGGNRVVGWG